MSFPVLKLGQKARERRERERKEDEKMVRNYDCKEVKIPNSDLIANKVYQGVSASQRKYATNDYVIIEHNSSYYPVIRIKSKKKQLPLLIDLDKLDLLRDFRIDDQAGSWNLTNTYVSFSRKSNRKAVYLHNVLTENTPGGSEKDSIDYLNRIHLDNRMCNLKTSDRNRNQKIRKCASTQIDKMPQPYRDYYLQNRSKFIYWLPSRTHGHRIFAGPCGEIKEKKFSSKDPKQIPKLMEKAEQYLLTEAKRYGMTEDQITSDLDPESYRLKREYEQITQKAALFFHLDL